MNAAKVESVDVDQTALGRLLDYGDVIVRGTGAGLNPIRKIDMPLDLRRAIVSRRQPSI
jgi:hypothetical protein